MKWGSALLLAGVVAGSAACADAPARSDAVAVGEEVTPVSGATPDARAVMAAADRMEISDVWPGFQPDTIAVALYDGQTTWLADYPGAAPGFAPSADDASFQVHEGRADVARANAPGELGGRPVAVVLLPMLDGLTPERAAAVVAHERFHAYMNGRHPEWQANELARFAYPVEDVQNLFLRRLETKALANALDAGSMEDAACWLSTAMIVRRRRTASMPASAAAYERGIERSEGLARYVERRAEGRDGPVDIAPNGYAPEDVRGRAYLVGEALAVMLDRFDPGWKATADSAGTPLDSLVAAALRDRPEASCGFSVDERDAMLAQSRDAIDVARDRESAALDRFEHRDGWRIRVLVEGAQPLWPQSFDPMSLTRAGEARLLHDRMLRVGNDQGSLDVYDHSVLTVGVGGEPLSNGVREVILTGIQQRPILRGGQGDSLFVTAPGISGVFRRARVDTSSPKEILIRLP